MYLRDKEKQHFGDPPEGARAVRGTVYDGNAKPFAQFGSSCR